MLLRLVIRQVLGLVFSVTFLLVVERYEKLRIVDLAIDVHKLLWIHVPGVHAKRVGLPIIGLLVVWPVICPYKSD